MHSHSSVLSLYKACLIGIITAILLGAFHFWPTGRAFDYHVNQRVTFLLRWRYGAVHWLDPRIKVFAMETRDIGRLPSDSLSAGEWDQMLQVLCRHKPRVILVSNTFVMLPGRDDKELARLRETLAHCPIVTRALVTQHFVTDRNQSMLTGGDYDPRHYTRDGSRLDVRPKWREAVYGPHPKLEDLLPRQGHGFLEDHMQVEPLLTREDGHVVPHWALYAAKSREVRDGKLYLDDKEVPLNYRGRVIVNLHGYWVYGQRVRPIHDLFENLRKNDAPLPFVSPDDVLVILNRMVPGDVDSVDTPHGEMPREFVNLAMLNSVLTGRWIRFLPRVAVGALLIFFCALGVLFGYYFSPAMFWVSTLSVMTLIFGSGIYAFLKADFLLPWGICIVGLLFSAIIVFLEKARLTAARARELRVSLEGIVDPRKLEGILKDPARLSFAPSNQQLTLVFIDIVGFSRAAEGQIPASVFASLKEVLSGISETVHRHGGIVDKTLGDGLLCFFGYDWDKDAKGSERTNPAEQALLCALEIQRASLKRNLDAVARGAPVYPLRIGVNTAEVHVGDLGGGRRIEFTVIGHGVNFAQRLQAACEGYAVMCGASTQERLAEAPEWKRRLHRRFIKVKHSEDLLQAYELDPFVDEPDLLDRGVAAYRNFAGLNRSEPRWRPHRELSIFAGQARGTLVDFSGSGVAVELAEYYARGVTLSLLFRAGGELEGRLARVGIHTLEGEVQWGRKVGEGRFLHGLLFRGLSLAQKDEFVATLKDWLGDGSFSLQPDSLVVTTGGIANA